MASGLGHEAGFLSFFAYFYSYLCLVDKLLTFGKRLLYCENRWQ